MRFFVLLIGLGLFAFSCKNSDENKVREKNESNYADFFYPTDSLKPFIYVYQNIDEPLDEKVRRIYRSETAEDTALVVECYNADLKITEGYTHSLKNNFAVEDHMIVDGDGKKRQAKLSSNTFFPKDKKDITQFVSDFPSHLDSMTMIYQSKRRILEADTTIEVLGEQVPAILIEDSVGVAFANPYTKESSIQKVQVSRFFAEGYGLVYWSANNNQIAYKLDKILPNKWWEEYSNSPKVKP